MVGIAKSVTKIVFKIGLFNRLQNFVCALVRINQGSLAQLVTKGVSEQLTGALVGQKLVLAQIDGDDLEAVSILHPLPGLFKGKKPMFLQPS